VGAAKVVTVCIGFDVNRKCESSPQLSFMLRVILIVEGGDHFRTLD
jgi:hypothetical protein